MDKILKTLQVRAENGDQDADAVFREIDGLNQNDFAAYVYTHDAQLRKILGVKNLVEKGGNPEFTKEYFDLYKQGRAMYERDPYVKNDVNSQPLKEIPYYMEKIGIPKEHGEYTREQQAAFANSVSNLDRDELANLAWQEGFEGDADQMRNEIARAGKRLQQQLYRSGYDQDGSWSFTGKAGNLARSFFVPRISEAHQAGVNASGADIAGDIAEGALNIIPGTGFLGKMAGKIGSKIPRIAASIGANAVETAAVPLVANAIDVGLYSGTGDPRGELDPERILAQTAGTIGIKGAVKAGAGNAKNLLELRAGKDAGGSWAKDAMDVIEDIGNSTKDNIARRQLVMERKAEMARNSDYNTQNYLTGAQNKTGYFATPDDLADAEDFMLRKSEAERFIKNQPDYEIMDKKTKDFQKLAGENTPVAYNPETSTIEITLQNGEMVTIPNVPQELFESMDEKKINELSTQAILKKHPELLDPESKARLEDYGNTDVVFQMPDGRLVSGNTVKNGADGKLYTDVFDQGLDAPNLTLLENNGEVSWPTREPMRVPQPDGSERVMTYKPRDYTVRRELANDKDFNRLISGQAKWEPFRDVAAQFIGNAGAREGWLGTGGNDLMGKRESALWNRQLKQLRKLVDIDGATPEYRRQMVDAIMNVMTFGLDDLPEDMFKANPSAYHAIANQLGSSDWKHNSEVGVADYPTTSYSSAR